MNRSSNIGKSTPDDEDPESSDGEAGFFGTNDYYDDDIDDFEINLPPSRSSSITHDNIWENNLTLPPRNHINDMNEDLLPDVPSDDFLDAICSGRIPQSLSTSSIFNGDSLQKLISGNIWAGSSYWKGARNSKMNESVKTSSKKNTAKKKRDQAKSSIAPTSIVDLYTPIQGPLGSSFNPSKRKGKVEDLLLKLKEKMYTDKHILPLDAGINVEHLGSFFLRPDILSTSEWKSDKISDNGRFFSNLIISPQYPKLFLLINFKHASFRQRKTVKRSPLSKKV